MQNATISAQSLAILCKSHKVLQSHIKPGYKSDVLLKTTKPQQRSNSVVTKKKSYSSVNENKTKAIIGHDFGHQKI